ncbi:MAG: efflux transporter outer membrane subunit [Syntrophales bacterium]|jgi:multidrug efflux system outer membrane protein|nr:efflux transporter outer membrane subunit [Syntrophales bacterium]
MNRNHVLLFGVIVTLLGGCTLAPKYSRPASPVPADWSTGAVYQETKTAASASTAAELPWREFFTDERLQKVIGIALGNNRDLRLAALNVERARALYGVQRAELLPTVNAAGIMSKERVPADLSSTGSARTAEQYSVNLGISSWELDFFGRIRSLKDRALEEYLATDQARFCAQILLISAVGNTYLTLAADREALKLVTSTLQTQEDSYRLIRKRYDVGLASELDLRRAQSQVDAARGDVARYTQLAAQDENALNLLVGSPIPTELLPAELVSVSPPREVSAGLSSELLLRRPDVLAAEHQLKAANANIGAARAAFFPRISLTTTIGTASADLSGLFKSGSGTWSFAPQIAVPIFDARTWSAYDVTKVEREISVAQYEKAIQTAFREVADALAVRDTVNRQIEAQQSLVDAVSETYRLSNARYTRGIDSYLSVLDAQRSLYSAQQGLIVLHLSRLANRVTLYNVLGGGQ